MPARVFISSGQRDEERNICKRIREILKNEFNLESYLAFKVQSTDDTMTIISELSRSDYLIFIDFKRKLTRKNRIPISLFSHQEFAIAHYLKFGDCIMAFQEEGVPREGILNSVLSNADKFSNSDELYQLIRRRIREKGWTPAFSRNLILAPPLVLSEVHGFSDHSDRGNNFRSRVWQVKVENRRPEMAARNCECFLDSAFFNGNPIDNIDRTPLKWAGQIGFSRTIFPKDHGEIDIISIREGQEGFYLRSAADFTTRNPIKHGSGKYLFRYRLFSQGFPEVSFDVEINLSWQADKLWPEIKGYTFVP